MYTLYTSSASLKSGENQQHMYCGAKFHKKNATCESEGARLQIQPGTLVLVVQIQIQNTTAVQICKYNILKLAKTWSLYAFWQAAVHFSWQKCILYDLDVLQLLRIDPGELIYFLGYYVVILYYSLLACSLRNAWYLLSSRVCTSYLFKMVKKHPRT